VVEKNGAGHFKHELHQQPDEKLLRHLNLSTVDELKTHGAPVTDYLPLPESELIKQGLAVKLDLPKDSDYGAIANTFAELANQCLEKVRQRTPSARITRRALPLLSSAG